MKVKEKRRACVTRFASTQKQNTYLKMILKNVVGGELAEVSTKKLKLAVDTMLLDTQANTGKKM